VGTEVVPDGVTVAGLEDPSLERSHEGESGLMVERGTIREIEREELSSQEKR
jgi:hypothetical protein